MSVNILEKAALGLAAGHDYIWSLGSCYVLHAYEVAVRDRSQSEEYDALTRPLCKALSLPGVAERLAALIHTELDRGELAGSFLPGEPPLWRSAAVACAGCLGPRWTASLTPYRAYGLTELIEYSGCFNAVLRGVVTFLKHTHFNTVLDSLDDPERHGFAIKLYWATYCMCWSSVSLTQQLRAAGIIPLLIGAVSVTAVQLEGMCALPSVCMRLLYLWNPPACDSMCMPDRVFHHLWNPAVCDSMCMSDRVLHHLWLLLCATGQELRAYGDGHPSSVVRLVRLVAGVCTGL